MLSFVNPKTLKIAYFIIVMIIYIFNSIYKVRYINDYFTHDVGTYLSVSVYPLEALSSLKGLTFPGFDYGSLLGAYLLWPFTFFELDLFSVFILFNLILRFSCYLILAVFLIKQNQFLLGYLTILYPLFVNFNQPELNFTWGYYFYAEIEIIALLLCIYVLVNVKNNFFIFSILGILTRIDPRIFTLVIISLIFFAHKKINSYKLFVEYFLKNLTFLFLGYLVLELYLKNTKPQQLNTFAFNQEYLNSGLVRFKEFYGFNFKFFILILLIINFLILIKIMPTLDKIRIIFASLLVIFSFILVLSSSRMVEIYLTMNPNRVLLVTPLSIVLFISLTLTQSNIAINDRYIAPIISILLLFFIINLDEYKSNLPTQGPAPVLDKFQLKKDCKNLVKSGPNIGTYYIETIDWRLGFVCDALLIPNKKFKFINANNMGLGEVRPWRRKLLN
jgi:hypothetical protein